MDIKISGLRKSFGDAVAIANLDLSVANGEMLVLLGPSGCGKTTTMRCIAGLEIPDAGSITIGGRTVFDAAKQVNVPANRRNLGMVFQSYAIWPHMTVFENVAYPLKMARRPQIEIAERVAEILASVGLEGFAGRGASYLSGGQMQRVALARSLVMRPSVLLFDEPLSNLDARLRDNLRVQLRELQTRLKITSVYVTHDQREALALADQIAVMQGGEILQIGDPISIYNGPKTSTIADFLGYTNIFDARITSRNDGFCNLVLEPGGERLCATGLPGSIEDSLTVCVRPDHVHVRVADAQSLIAVLADNTFQGEVTLASFMGSHIQYRVRADGGAMWDVFCPGTADSIKIGSRVLLDVPPANLRLVPRS